MNRNILRVAVLSAATTLTHTHNVQPVNTLSNALKEISDLKSCMEWAE